MFIAIEGIEGSGKSTQAVFLCEYLKSLGIKVLHTREPGGTVIAEKIRALILEQNIKEPLTMQSELLLLFAARSQHLNNLIIPALNSCQYVICERFIDATFAYQGGGRGIDFKRIEFLANFVQNNLNPDLVLLFDLNVDLALSRIEARGKLDRIEKEQKDFFERTRRIYLKRAKENLNKYYIINASLDLETIQEQVKSILTEVMKNVNIK